MLWIEKYRPRELEDILGQETIIRYISSWIAQQKIPNLLLYGPPGTGKLSLSLIIAGRLYDGNLTYINVSDFFSLGKPYLERSPKFRHFLESRTSQSLVEIFKRCIGHFAGIRPLGSKMKIIFFDNSEYLREDAQHALRRMIERYMPTCRFIFSSLQPGELIPQIRSRCVSLCFSPLPGKEIKRIVGRIANTEKIQISEDAMDAIIYNSFGSAERAINLLQTASSISRKIKAETIFRVERTVHPEEIEKLSSSLLTERFMESKEALDSLLIDHGLSGTEIVRHLHSLILGSQMSERRKAELLISLAETEIGILEGMNERIHLSRFLTS
jgi:replication factor C small subunit